MSLNSSYPLISQVYLLLLNNRIKQELLKVKIRLSWKLPLLLKNKNLVKLARQEKLAHKKCPVKTKSKIFLVLATGSQSTKALVPQSTLLTLMTRFTQEVVMATL